MFGPFIVAGGTLSAGAAGFGLEVAAIELQPIVGGTVLLDPLIDAGVEIDPIIDAKIRLSKR